MNKINYYISTKKDGNLALHIGDDEDKVLNNRNQLAKKLNLEANDFIFLNQIHGNDVIFFDKSNISFDGDAIVSKNVGFAIGVMVADCVPILLYDELNNIIGAVHAGWRGTSKKIVKKTIDKMISIGANLKSIVAIIGPSISQENYEVDREVGDNFRKEVKIDLKNGKLLLNLKKENELQILETGVSKQNISISNIDTYSNLDYFSARRNKNEGRIGAFIWINKD